MRTVAIVLLLVLACAAGCNPADAVPSPQGDQEKGPATTGWAGPTPFWATPTRQHSTYVAQGPQGGQEKKVEPPIPLEKWGHEHLVKTWGMRLKSVTYDDRARRCTFSVELMKDLSTEELQTARRAFANNAGVLAVYFFDKDMAVIGKRTDFEAKSEITGVKGDAFRLEVPGEYESGGTRDVVKVEFRPVK